MVCRFRLSGRGGGCGSTVETLADQSAAVIPSHPPETIMRVMNSLLPRLLRTPLAGGARKQVMVLGFNGRKSGRRLTVTVSAHLIDDVCAVS